MNNIDKLFFKLLKWNKSPTFKWMQNGIYESFMCWQKKKPVRAFHVFFDEVLVHKWTATRRDI